MGTFTWGSKGYIHMRVTKRVRSLEVHKKGYITRGSPKVNIT